MFVITMDSSQLTRIMTWYDKLVPTIMDPKIVSYGVRFIGIGMKNVFRTEGAAAGRKWQNLTVGTQNLREARGYPRAHPILVQSGGLRGISADALSRWTIGTLSTAMSDGDGTAMAASSRPLEFTARIRGPKVENHFGARLSYPRVHGAIPPRPFFGITEDAAYRASEAIANGVVRQWGMKSTGVRFT